MVYKDFYFLEYILFPKIFIIFSKENIKSPLIFLNSKSLYISQTGFFNKNGD